METARLEEFQYELPEDRIARFPLEPRDRSKLLTFRSGNIEHHHFFNLPEFIPSGSLLVFNDTRVIPARLRFQKVEGALIEIMLLKPEQSWIDYALAMQKTGSSDWLCMIGNKKRWPDNLTLRTRLLTEHGELILDAGWKNRAENLVSLSWSPSHYSFSEVLQYCGDTPLPPYLDRAAAPHDKVNYQTVYAKHEGAVAAPTAGLHFTEEVFNKLKQNGIRQDFVTLHVSAGTFQPVKVSTITEHPMHGEQIIISRQLLESLLKSTSQVIAVGTTSMRTLESLYWYGALLDQDSNAPFFIPKLIPYQQHVKAIGPERSFVNLIKKMDQLGLDRLTGTTEIFIFPGYQFKVCKGLITNFHQPGSTLMMLIAAFVGPVWKEIYEEALQHSYRFLSYGDSSLLLPN
jgi:S-adenosylmethionine:tRNA ribosyltransferase-isomerase